MSLSGTPSSRHEFVAHRSLADHSENGSHIACGKVAADHAVTLDECDLGTLSRRSDRSADSGRSRTGYDDVVTLAHVDTLFVMQSCHNIFIISIFNTRGLHESVKTFYQPQI